jgi:hypothetical protein
LIPSLSNQSAERDAVSKEVLLLPKKLLIRRLVVVQLVGKAAEAYMLIWN